jgi:antitoxin (DNA-binding transcriptional repressor) of toxin-antitoxin stability system
VKAAEAGEEVVLARRGAPVARIVPLSAPAVEHPRGSAAGLLAALERHPPSWPRRTAEEVEAIVEEERNAWD